MRVRRPLALTLLVLVGVGACAAAGTSSGSRPAARASRSWQERIIRVALATGAPRVRVSATGAWRLFGDRGEVVARLGAGTTLIVERTGNQLRITRENGATVSQQRGTVVVSATDEDAPVLYDGQRYRGELWIAPGDVGVRVVNRLYVEDYLRSVVPAEIGALALDDHAAAEAQAIAARSYVYTRLGDLAETGGHDVVAGVMDQVYRGVASERPTTDLAVNATQGLVLYYRGRPVSAPYHSTCGGSTAAASEVFRSGDEPHLQPVSDRVPGSDRFYCDRSARFRWTRSFDEESLERAMNTWLRQYAREGRGPVGSVRALRTTGHTPTGRVAALEVTTDAGTFRLRGNDIRFVLRAGNGEILNSTYFSLSARSAGGRVRAVTIDGRGYGHGVGMCQWGAIGRARAGQDYRAILATYFPGTTIAQAR